MFYQVTAIAFWIAMGLYAAANVYAFWPDKETDPEWLRIVNSR